MSETMSDRLEMMQERMLGKGFGAVLGPKLEQLEEGFCRMSLAWREDLSRGDARIHGGVIAALIDKAVTSMVAEARTVRRGGSIIVVDVDVLNETGGKVAKGLVTYKLSPPKST